jgi:PEP-CTERM motif
MRLQEDSMRRFLVLVGVLGVVLLSAAPAHAAEISFDSKSVTLGEQFDVDVLLTENVDSLVSFAFGFEFNSSVLNFVQATAGNLFTGLFLAPTVGDQFVIGFSPVDETSGDFVPVTSASGILATLTFSVFADGDPNLALVAPADTPMLLATLNGELFEVQTSLRSGTISLEGQPAPVPEPSTFGLVGLGVVSLIRRLRRQPAAH